MGASTAVLLLRPSGKSKDTFIQRMEELSTDNSTGQRIVKDHEEPQHKKKMDLCYQKRKIGLDPSRGADNQAKKLKILEGSYHLQQGEPSVVFREEFTIKLVTEAICGSPQQRGHALAKLGENVRSFVIMPIFDCIITWLMRSKLEDQAIRFLMEATHKLLHKLDNEQTQHLVPKIIVAVQPFLGVKAHCMKGREIIYDLSKMAGLDAMTAIIGAQMNDESEYVRDMAAKAFGIVASALGIFVILPFLHGACHSKESWRVRHTGIKMVEQIAACMGCTLEPHVKSLVNIIINGLLHKDLEVVRITALSLAALADAVAPHGHEIGKAVYRLLLDGVGGAGFLHRTGNVLAALVKLCCSIIPLVGSQLGKRDLCRIKSQANLLLEEPDEKAKEIALQTLKRLAESGNFDTPREVFRNLWGKTILNRKNHKLVVDVTISLAGQLGAARMKKGVVKELEGYSDLYKETVMEIIEKALACCVGASEDDAEFEDVFQDMVLLFRLPM